MEKPDGPEGSGVARTIIVVVVIAIVVAASLFAVFYFTFNSLFAPLDRYSTDASVTPVAGQTALVVIAGNSNINIDQGSGSAIYVNLSVTARMNLTAQNVYISVDTYGTTVKITLHTPTSAIALSSNGNLYLPASMTLNYLNLTTTNGNENIGYPVNASSISMVTSNGNIGVTSNAGTAGLSGGDIYASTSNGNININGTEFKGISATTSNGNVLANIHGKIVDGQFTFKSSNGNLGLFLENLSQASFYLSTTNGAVSASNLDILATTSTSHTLIGTLNGGGASINMQTTNGNIELGSI